MLLTLVLPALAESAPSVALPCSLTVGETFRYEMVSTDTNHRIPDGLTIRSTFDLTVLEQEQTDTGTTGVIQLRYGAGEIEGMDAMPAELRRMLALSLAFTTSIPPVELTVDNFSLTGVRNRDAVIPVLRGAMESGLAELSAGAAPEEVAMMQGMIDQLLSPTLLEQSLLKPIAPMFSMSCAQMTLGEPVAIQTSLPHPLLQTPVPATYRADLAAIMPDAARFTSDVRSEPDLLRGVLSALPAEALAQTGLTTEAIEAIPMEQYQTADLTVSTRDGWLVEGTHTAVTEATLGEQRIFSHETHRYTRLAE